MTVYSDKTGSSNLSTRDAQIGIVIAALVPLAGIALLGWSLKEVLLWIWLEGLVGGAFIALRLYVRPPWRLDLLLVRIPILGFYILFWLAFVMSHLLAILVLFHPEGPERFEFPEDPRELFAIVTGHYHWAAAGALVLIHALVFVKEWLLAKGWRKTSELGLFAGLLGRVMLIQIVITAAGAAMLVLNAPGIFVLVLVLTKLALDLAAERRRRKSAA